jgi:hypothetical protein
MVRLFVRLNLYAFECSRPQKDFAVFLQKAWFVMLPVLNSCDSRHEPVNKSDKDKQDVCPGYDDGYSVIEDISVDMGVIHQ